MKYFAAATLAQKDSFSQRCWLNCYSNREGDSHRDEVLLMSLHHVSSLQVSPMYLPQWEDPTKLFKANSTRFAFPMFKADTLPFP